MKEQNTNYKGDLAQAKVIYELTKLGYDIYTPISDHPKADLIIQKDNIVYRIQCKHSKTGIVKNTSTCNRISKIYQLQDFDFYAVLLPSIDQVIYIPIKLGGIHINVELPQTYGKFWWYEDFLEIKQDGHKQRLIEDFSIKLEPKINYRAREKWPTKEVLETLVKEKPMLTIGKEYGVSGKMVEKWCKIYGIERMGRGFWSKSRTKAIKVE